MLKGILGYLGLRSAAKRGLFGKRGRSIFRSQERRGFGGIWPVGGALPLVGYLAWRNRDKIRGLLHGGKGEHSHA